MYQLTGRILITGGSGFLARGIISRAHAWPCDITIISRNAERQQAILNNHPGVKGLLADVRDTQTLELVMQGYDTVIHAATTGMYAIGERNVGETLSSNIGGAVSVISAARNAGVKKVLFLSADKAVRPISVYGMTKALIERLVCEAGARSGRTAFHVVRLGNIAGATGSAIPLMKDYYKRTGKIMLTDPEATRFWLGLGEAVDLICWTLENAPSGVITTRGFDSLKIKEVAKILAPEADIEIFGSRPGDRPHEDLIHENEGIQVRPVIYSGLEYLFLQPSAIANDNVYSEGWSSPYTYSSQSAPSVTPERMAEIIKEGLDA